MHSCSNEEPGSSRNINVYDSPYLDVQDDDALSNDSLSLNTERIVITESVEQLLDKEKPVVLKLSFITKVRRPTMALDLDLTPSKNIEQEKKRNALCLRHDEIITHDFNNNLELDSYVSIQSLYNMYKQQNIIDTQYDLIQTEETIKLCKLVQHKVSGYNTSRNNAMGFLFKFHLKLKNIPQLESVDYLLNRWITDIMIFETCNEHFIQLFLQYIVHKPHFTAFIVGRSWDAAFSIAYQQNQFIVRRTLPCRPQEFFQNREFGTWSDRKYKIYIMLSNPSISSIALEFDEFFQSNFIEQPKYIARTQQRLLLLEYSMRQQNRTLDSNIQAKLSQLCSYISWVYSQLADKNQKLHITDYFHKHLIISWYKFQLHQISRSPLTQSITLSHNFEMLKATCKKLELWLPQSSIITNNYEQTQISNNLKLTISYLESATTFSNFKKCVWINVSKHATYLEQCNAHITSSEFVNVQKAIIKLLNIIHQLWLSTSNNLKLCEKLWIKWDEVGLKVNYGCYISILNCMVCVHLLFYKYQKRKLTFKLLLLSKLKIIFANLL